MLFPEATMVDYEACRPVLDAMATKTVRDSIRLARLDAVMKHHKKKGIHKMTRAQAAQEYLKAKEYKPWCPDWMDKCPRAWRDLSRLWASKEWIEKSKRNRSNRDANPEICTTYLGGRGMGHLARDLVSIFFVALISLYIVPTSYYILTIDYYLTESIFFHISNLTAGSGYGT